MTEQPDDPRIPAALAMIGRTGADEMNIRFSEEPAPVVWIAAAHWPASEVTAPGIDGTIEVPDRWDAAGGMTPWRAVFRLCEAVIDGGTCAHCGRPTMVDEQPASELLAMLDGITCAYRYDPELDTFRRSCEGRT